MKGQNSEFTTLFGGYTADHSNPVDDRRSYTNTEYTCLYGRLRICYSSTDLIDGWIHRSLHWNNVINDGIAWDFHIAYRFKWPFLKVGFENIKDLYTYLHKGNE